jgi:hypothetical protein
MRQAATALERAIEERGYILALSMHHFQELLVHSNSDVVAQRISFIQSLPLVAIVNSVLGEGVAGSVFDIQAAEVMMAFERPDATARAIRDDVAARLFQLTSGSEAMRPFIIDLPSVQAELSAMAEKHRQIVAITGSDFAGVSKKRIADLLKGSLHAPLDIQRNIARLDAALSNGEWRQSGPTNPRRMRCRAYGDYPYHDGR